MSTPAEETSSYQPGVCNIGRAERDRRRRIGHLGTGVGVLLLVAVAALRLPAYYGLASTVFFATGASGYIQDRMGFCAGYARVGMYNLGSLDRDPESVSEEEARKQDLRTARRIFASSAAIGIAMAVVGWLAIRLV